VIALPERVIGIGRNGRSAWPEYAVSAKKWTKYERRAVALESAVAADAIRLFPQNLAGRKQHTEKLEKWIAHLGIAI
jgi:hypothetical protein